MCFFEVTESKVTADRIPLWMTFILEFATVQEIEEVDIPSGSRKDGNFFLD
jgi:hypothetical protein